MDQVDEIKQKTDIVAVIGEHLELKKAGRNFKGLCPFHGEKSPSFIVSPELQIYRCFGCGEGGDVISFLQKREGMEFYEALSFLADRAGVKLKSFDTREIGEKEGIYHINAICSRFYNYVLTTHTAGKAALFYLTQKRGLKIDTIKTFSLGYSPNDPNVLINFLKKKGFKYADVNKSGIAFNKGNALLDRFWGRVIFPLFDHRGNVAGFAGRLLPEDKRENTGKYINSPETLVYHKSDMLYGLNLSKKYIRDEGSVIVVEGELDMISLFQAGFKNVVAIKGTAITQGHIRLLTRFADKFIFALDSDIAGNSAAKKGIKLAQDAGVDIVVCDLGDYHDPDEMARENKKAFSNALKKANNIWDFLIDSVFKKYGIDKATDKSKTSREVTEILVDIEDKIMQAHYVDKVAKRLSVPYEAVAQQVDKGVNKKQFQKPDVEEDSKDKTRRELLEEAYLVIAFQTDPKRFVTKQDTAFIKSPLYRKIIDKLLVYEAKNKEFDLSAFSESLPPELFAGFSQLVMKEANVQEGNLNAAQKELDEIIIQIDIMSTKEEMNEVSNLIAQNENKDDKMVASLQKRLKELTENLSKLEERQNVRIILDNN